MFHQRCALHGERDFSYVLFADGLKKWKQAPLIESLSRNVATFFSWWLEYKTWIPLNTNAIESAFSLVKNRIPSIGRGWIDKGLLNWLQVAVNKVFHPEIWQQLWSRYMSLNPGFELMYVQASWSGSDIHNFATMSIS